MDHHNHYAYLADYPLYSNEETNQYDDCVDEFFEYSSPAAQGCGDRSLDATQAEASFLSHSYNGAVNGDWCIASNHNNEIHFDNHFFDDTAGLETKMKNNQFATELSCDSQLFGSGMNANNQTQTLLARAKIQTTSAESFSPNLERDEKVHRTQHNTPRCYSFTAQDSASDDDPNQAIGTALKNGKYKCNMVACAEKSFKRPAELRRHYNTIHAAQKPEFWCEVVSCERSLAGPAGVAAGGQPFHRKYRLQAHMQKVHHNRVNADSCDDVTDE